MPELPRVKENMSQDKRTGMDLLNRTLVAKEMTPRAGKGTCMGFQSLCKAKQTTSRVNRQPPEWEKNLCQLDFRQGVNV